MSFLPPGRVLRVGAQVLNMTPCAGTPGLPGVAARPRLPGHVRLARLGASQIIFASAICDDRRLRPGCFRIQVPSQFHGVVQHPSDHEQCWLNTVDQKVTGPADYASGCVHVPTTQSQMP